MSAMELPSRIPPHNLDAERAVLGAVLLEGREALPRVVEILQPVATSTPRRTARSTTRCCASSTAASPSTSSPSPRSCAARISSQFVGGPAALALLVEQALDRRPPHVVRGHRARHGGAARADPDLDPDHHAGLRGQGGRAGARRRRRAPHLRPGRAAARGQRAARRRASSRTPSSTSSGCTSARSTSPASPPASRSSTWRRPASSPPTSSSSPAARAWARRSRSTPR